MDIHENQTNLKNQEKEKRKKNNTEILKSKVVYRFLSGWNLKNCFLAVCIMDHLENRQGH